MSAPALPRVVALAGLVSVVLTLAVAGTAAGESASSSHRPACSRVGLVSSPTPTPTPTPATPTPHVADQIAAHSVPAPARTADSVAP